MNIPFKIGNILLPQNTDMTKWSVMHVTNIPVNQNI